MPAQGEVLGDKGLVGAEEADEPESKREWQNREFEKRSTGGPEVAERGGFRGEFHPTSRLEAGAPSAIEGAGDRLRPFLTQTLEPMAG